MGWGKDGGRKSRKPGPARGPEKPGFWPPTDTLLLVLALVTLARLGSAALANPAPLARPGDIITVSRSGNLLVSQQTIPARLLASAWVRPGKSCILDLGYMARPGGALTVLAVRPDGVMADWAGGQTAPDDDACRQGRGGILIPSGEYRALLTSLMPRH